MKRPAFGPIAVAVVTSACGSGGAAPQKAAPAGPPTVEVAQVVEQSIDVPLSLPGELEPYEAVAIFPKVTGFVKTIPVDRGSRVRAGEVLATLEAPEVIAQRAEAQSKLQAAQAQVAAARARADASASTYDKLKAASTTPGAVAGNELLQAQKTVESDRNETAAAEQNVEATRQALSSVTEMEAYLRITAPFAGVVTERNVHPGALVGPATGSPASTPMLRIADVARLRLLVAIPEAYVAGIQEGTSMPFTVAAYPGETFSGNVARIAHAVDEKTRTMTVELDVANADGRLAPGAFCQVKWAVRRTTPSLFVPSGSVAATTERTFVIRIRNGKTEWVDVKTGLSSGSLVEVFGALHAGDQVAARGTDELKSGSEVQIRAAKPST
jgi:RND family efflux transporter MFP subunit